MNRVNYNVDNVQVFNNPCAANGGAKKADSAKSKKCVDVKGGVIDTCDNSPVPLTPIETGAVAKIPVVLAELTVQFNVTSKIDLPEPALEIKDIKKRVKITQCLLLQNTNVLFIKGFVRKNIQFATKDCSNKKGVCGDIRHCTVDVPFECSTPVTFNGNQPLPVINNTSNEFEYFRVEKLPNNFAEKDKLLSGDFSEFNQTSTEFFNELPFCELICSRIVEFDEFLDRYRPSKGDLPFEEKLFDKIEEKMVIFLTLKILQKQQVAISPTNG
ncbi:CsxC family protein [Gottschalkia purinilytica]|uniref:CsxC family protein n=1 Tax=Gottschalkia purinilytica TaxID=1503 RepID=UPI000ADC6355|nr:hypothetical protein [Gottschalkia purinilytica]